MFVFIVLRLWLLGLLLLSFLLLRILCIKFLFFNLLQWWLFMLLCLLLYMLLLSLLKCSLLLVNWQLLHIYIYVFICCYLLFLGLLRLLSGFFGRGWCCWQGCFWIRLLVLKYYCVHLCFWGIFHRFLFHLVPIPKPQRQTKTNKCLSEDPALLLHRLIGSLSHCHVVFKPSGSRTKSVFFRYTQNLPLCFPQLSLFKLQISKTVGFVHLVLIRPTLHK